MIRYEWLTNLGLMWSTDPQIAEAVRMLGFTVKEVPA